MRCPSQIAVEFEHLRIILWELYLFGLHKHYAEILGPKIETEFSLCCHCLEARML